MRNRKMIAIGGAALALIAAAAGIFALAHKNSGVSDDIMFDLVENVETDQNESVYTDENGKSNDIDLGGYRIPELSNGRFLPPSDETVIDEELSDQTNPQDINREQANPEKKIILVGEDSFISEENEPESPDKEDSEEDICVVTPIKTNGYKEHEVLCNAQSKEEAEHIANAISGTLLSLNQGTAIIQIEESVDDLLARLEQEGSELQLYRHYIF